MLNKAGRNLAQRVLQSTLSNHEIITKRLVDILSPGTTRGMEWQSVIEQVCAQIPVYCLQYSPITHEDFTAVIYELLNRMQIDIDYHGDVLEFFRGFCCEFFDPGSYGEWRENAGGLPEMGRPRLAEFDHAQQEAAELARILATRSSLWEHLNEQQSANIPVNFNDLLVILQDSYLRGELHRAIEREEQAGDPGFMYKALVKVIECMTPEERLEPTLLLEHYDSVRRYRRRARIATSAELSLSLVDHCLAALAEFRRNYQLYLQGMYRH
jgi:hypothetical protein